MADTATDHSAPTPSRGHQRTPPQGQKRRNRKNNNNNNNGPSDGTVSDGALITSAQTPQSKVQRQRQSMAVPIPGQQDNGARKASAPKARHISAAGALPPNTPAREQAYAGPTFQASPAASALPVPKFFSRSVPNANGQPSLQGRMAGEKTPEANDSSPEADVVSPVPPSRQMLQSPLDLFFKADRAEKEKSRSNSETLSPAAAARLPQPATMPRNSHTQNQGRNIFLQELDGDDLPSPRTNPPTRPQVGERARSSPGVPQFNDDDKQVYTKNLKDLLFNTAASASPVANSSPRSMYNNPPSPTTNSHSPAPNFHSPSPAHNGYGNGNATFNNYNPSTPPSQSQTDFTPMRDPSANGNYHYGNRNLSPLFKAAARDTPSRPSALRQEIGSPGPVYNNVNFNQSNGAIRNEHSGWNSSGHNNGNGYENANGNDAARHFLDQQVRASAPAELPEFGFRPQQGGTGGSNRGPGGAGGNGGTAGQSQDLRVMEDDLRRILKLNVLG